MGFETIGDVLGSNHLSTQQKQHAVHAATVFIVKNWETKIPELVRRGDIESLYHATIQYHASLATLLSLLDTSNVNS